jgi:hypothetical protein
VDRHRLAGVVLKLTRAEEHLATLNQSIEEFLKSDFYSTRGELDRQRRILLRVDEIHTETPAAWGVLIGEIIYNLRSALDHLAYELAVANHLPARLPEKIAATSAFPIFRNGRKYRKRTRKGDPANDSGLYKIRGCHRTAQAAIRRMQPYHRRKNPDAWTLWQLEQLSNIDKHRTLHLTAAQTAMSRYGIEGTGWSKLHGIEIGTGPFKPNAILARFNIDWIDEPNRNVDVEAVIVPDIVFDKTTPAAAVRGASVLDTSLFRSPVPARASPCTKPGLATRPHETSSRSASRRCRCGRTWRRRAVPPCASSAGRPSRRCRSVASCARRGDRSASP